MNTRNRELHVQQTGNPFASAMRHTVKWHYQSELKSPLIRWSPLIRFIGWWDSYVINKHLSKMLEERYVELRSDRTSNSTNKSVIDLLLSDYMSKQKDQSGPTLDPEFRKWAIPQLRLMFFVGHDSTAATISYTFYLLSKNPWILEKVRQEHDEAFSTDVSEAPRLLREQPHLLNKLTYTTAVIKEVLRLFPPASGFRLGRPEVQLHNNGKSYPTKGTRVWVLHSSLHKNPKYWKEPQSFIPERFLVGPDDPLYPVKGAWRPFEYGPRNCIGQALAMMELRVTLVMTVRLFDVEPAYEEWDRMNNTAQHRVCTFLGERAYQTGNIGAHPADGMPCRISVRN